MIDSNFSDCAATYLYSNIQKHKKVEIKKVRKVEPVHSVNTGKRFNLYAAEKANYNHLDTSI